MSTPTTTQVMMTLAGLAATGATVRPSGETLEQQQTRIQNGINAQLADASLATSNEWTATWVGLTQDRANLAYIAQNTSAATPTYALCLRGTYGGSTIDTAEDMKVGTVLPFAAGGAPNGGAPGNISQGAMEAFTEIIMGTNLVEALQGLPQCDLYVTGHSLGGALVTTVSLYLVNSVQNFSTANIHPYTFAAPTAGIGDFAAWFDQQFPSAVCVFNYYDVVPNAWANLETVEGFYPNNSIGFGLEIKQIIKGVAKSTGSNIYVQPNQQPALNTGFTKKNPNCPGTLTTLADWEAEAGFQHANNTYLSLLQAPLLQTGPTVTSVSPASGPSAGSTLVTITGTGFTPDSVVDFGVVPGISPAIVSDTSITVTSPPGIGIVDVRVTNMGGTSPAVPQDQFTYTS